MDFLCSFPSASPSSYTSTPLPPFAVAASASSVTAGAAADGIASSSGAPLGREGGENGSAVCEMVGAFISGLLTCVFAMVGLFLGAATGACIGVATESGLFRGAGIGAISGAVFSIDVVESSLVMWRSRGSGIRSVIYVVDVVASLLNGRLVREEVGPAVQNAVRSQMSAVDGPFSEDIDIFETGGTKGMARASIDKIPRIRITSGNRVDSSGEQISCSVCLQDLEPGETARCLPHCGHLFHLPCIDGWLISHGSCPLCRRDL
ncbi:hypothetical protein Taro_052555 [Colocasia esculenta]|uniref:RING-type domain-containing protein n=1 Tax=Colocasia esculenta TaxID=4460 RepID=A0A843XIS2_COLES|nr:hypothetical protein [Colocasia esculenta]